MSTHVHVGKLYIYYNPPHVSVHISTKIHVYARLYTVGMQSPLKSLITIGIYNVIYLLVLFTSSSGTVVFFKLTPRFAAHNQTTEKEYTMTSALHK